jgi:pimeloyl-ACP methyl ester carboxylesterase
VNGFVYVTEGAARPGRNAAARDVVLSHGKLEVSRIRAIRDVTYELGPDVHTVSFTRRPTPILLIPPLMVRPYVYDLRPEHSMVRTLRNAGFDVFVVDFGVPGREDEDVRLDDYVLDWVPRSVDAVLSASGASGLTLAGYCMGGIFCLMHVGTHRDDRVKNIVTIGAPVNFRKMRAAYVASRIGAFGIGPLMDLVGNVPGRASSLGFKLGQRHDPVPERSLQTAGAGSRRKESFDQRRARLRRQTLRAPKRRCAVARVCRALGQHRDAGGDPRDRRARGFERQDAGLRSRRPRRRRRGLGCSRRGVGKDHRVADPAIGLSAQRPPQRCSTQLSPGAHSRSLRQLPGTQRFSSDSLVAQTQIVPLARRSHSESATHSS